MVRGFLGTRIVVKFCIGLIDLGSQFLIMVLLAIKRHY